VRRSLSGGALLAALTVAAEPILGIHGHWPLGSAALLGAGGSVLLALGGKALGRAGLQRPDTADGDGDGA
jgi:hypothetical protein